MKEEEVKNKYPNASLHEIDKNRVCLSINQLKLVLGFKDDNFNNIFVDLCQKELDKKKGKSLDFFDLSNLIDKSINEVKKKDLSFDSNSSFVTFKPKPSMNFEEKIKNIEKQLEKNKYLLDGLLGTYSCFEINFILKKTEDALKNFEQRIIDLEKRQTNMDKIINYFTDKIKEEEKINKK